MTETKKAVLITGAAKRLGRAMAERFAAAGYDIALHYHTSREAAESLRRQIESAGRQCVLFPQDLTEPEALPDFMARVKQALPHLAVLVNSASTFRRIGFAETTPQSLAEDMRINFEAPFFLTQAFAKQVKKGAVVNLLDIHIHSFHKQYMTYLMAKKALAEFTLMAAKELAPAIRVNAVCPGFVLPTEGGSHDPTRAVPGEQPTPAQVADAVLTAAEKEYLFGQFLYVDGGERLGA